MWIKFLFLIVPALGILSLYVVKWRIGKMPEVEPQEESIDVTELVERLEKAEGRFEGLEKSVAELTAANAKLQRSIERLAEAFVE
jgi:predicted RNase H-like nuclease (RuvC/YqgF family)